MAEFFELRINLTDGDREIFDLLIQVTKGKTSRLMVFEALGTLESFLALLHHLAGPERKGLKRRIVEVLEKLDGTQKKNKPKARTAKRQKLSTYEG